MKKIMNICTHYSDLERYRDTEDLRAYYRGLGLDGLEVLEIGKDERGILQAEDTIGVHLKYFPCWYCLWSGDTKTLQEEFESREDVEQYFGGQDREAILRAFRENLKFARSFQPEYVVFHVADVILSEVVNRKHRYSDEQIVDGAAEILNSIFQEDEGFELLLENLWWPGMTMTDPEITYRLLNKVNYPRTGIMLDTGHLLHTNTSLRTSEEGVKYIRKVMERYEDRSMIRGIHFHQTISGAYVEEMKPKPPVLKGTYSQKNDMLGEYIFRVDSHKPFLGKEAADMVKWLDPEYLVFELLPWDKSEHERWMREALSWWKDK